MNTNTVTNCTYKSPPGLRTIWSDGGDSLVQTDGKTCIKLYYTTRRGVPHINTDILDVYKRKQSLFSRAPMEIRLEEGLLLGEAYVDQFLVHTLDIDVPLLAASLLDSKESVITACIPYIEGCTLQEITNTMGYDTIFGEVNPYRARVLRVIHAIQERIIGTACFDMSLPYFGKMGYQTNPNNIKVVSVDPDSSSARLVITDLCMDIVEFVQRNTK